MKSIFIISFNSTLKIETNTKEVFQISNFIQLIHVEVSSTQLELLKEIDSFTFH